MLGTPFWYYPTLASPTFEAHAYKIMDFPITVS